MDKSTKQIMDSIFNDYAEHFHNDTDYPYDTALVFAFSDYIDSKEGAEAIADRFGLDEDYIGDDGEEFITSIRGEFSRGINAWLEA